MNFQIKKTYIPLAEKLAFAEYCGSRCFDRMEIHASDGGENVPMPPMYKENAGLKMRYLMGALVKMYLGLDYEPVEGDEWLLSQDDYDRFAAMHPLNALERMKSDKDKRDRVFDMMADYKALEKIVNAEVYGLLQVMNEPTNRIMAMFSAQSTPEAMQEAADAMAQAKAEMDAFLKDRAEKADSKE